MTKRLSTGWTLVVVGLTVVGLLAGLRWYYYPANRLGRALDAIDMPREVRQDGEVVADGGWLCIDSCSDAYRFYVTDLPPAEAAPLVEAAMRRAGFEGRMEPCVSHDSPTYCGLSGPTEYSKGVASYRMSFDGGFVDGLARVGRREDGRYGIQLLVVANGYG